MSEHRRAYRRVAKALRLAQSGEADSIVAAAKEILSTRIKHGDALSSPGAVRDYLRLLLHDREHEVFAAVFLDANSSSNWTRIPRQTGQPFQSKLDTDSTTNWTVK